MTLHTDIKSRMIAAMKAKEIIKLSVLRGLLAAITYEAVAKGRKPDEELSDDEALAVISRAVKQRKDSIEQFKKGGRPDLAETEEAEMAILQTYLPAQMSADEIENYVKNKLSQESPNPSKKGQFMGIIMKELKGKADGTIVKQVLDKLLDS